MLKRRAVLTAVAATIAAPALAQTTRNESAKDSPKGASTSERSGAGPGKVGAVEQKHVTDTMAVGSMSLVASRIAINKARDEDVKAFAEFEVAEQEIIADVLTSMMDLGKATGKSNPPSDAEALQLIPQEERVTLQKMEQMDGDELEGAYVIAQTAGHQRLLLIQEEYLANGKELAHINVAKLARGQINEHLRLLADLSEEDDNKSPTTGRSSRTKR